MEFGAAKLIECVELQVQHAGSILSAERAAEHRLGLCWTYSAQLCLSTWKQQEGQVQKKREGTEQKKGKKVESLQASPGSNHSGGKESRPLRRQPVSEQWEGARPAQAVLFIQTHTDQLVSLAASFLFIPQCRSQLQSEQQRAAPIMSHSGC